MKKINLGQFNLKISNVRKIFLLTFIATVLSGAIVTFHLKYPMYSIFVEKNERYFYKGLTSKVGQKETIIPIYSLTNFIWDKLIILAPYTERNLDTKYYIESKYHVSLDEIWEEIPELNQDNAWAFIFVNKNKAIEIMKSRKYIFETSDFVLSQKSYIKILERNFNNKKSIILKFQDLEKKYDN